MASQPNEIWALTTLYNPAQYRRRVQNFYAFRDNISIPLCVVELAAGAFSLTKGDADVLVQLNSDSVLWHKEMLLNIALDRIPDEASYVAWLDCDLIFERHDWPNLAIGALQSAALVQLFSELIDLPRDTEPNPSLYATLPVSGLGIAYLQATKLPGEEDFVTPKTKRAGRRLFGGAWAARRDLLDKHRFYDFLVLGGGDKALTCAGYGKFPAAVQTMRMNDVGLAHYLEWAEPFFDDVNARIGYVPGRIFHLWHGELEQRRYVERYIDFNSFGFDPNRHVHRNPQGLLEWQPGTEDLQRFVLNYFSNRREDG